MIGQWRLRQRTLIGDEPAQLALTRATTAAVEAARQIGQAPAALTVADGLGLYWKHAKEKYGRRPGDPLTKQKNLARIQTALRCANDEHGQTPITRFGPLALMAVREKMIEDRRSRRYINVLVRTIQRAFKWLVQREIIPPAIQQALAAVEGLRRGRGGPSKVDMQITWRDYAEENVLARAGVPQPPLMTRQQLERSLPGARGLFEELKQRNRLERVRELFRPFAAELAKIAAETAAPPPPQNTPATVQDADYPVTLKQACVLAGLKPETIRRKLGMPKPDIRGGAGRSHKWRWESLRAWLAPQTTRELPARFACDARA